MEAIIMIIILLMSEMLLQAAELAVINQECVIGGDQWGIKDYPCFNVRTEVAAAIANAGFDVVLAATNHVLDIGKVGSLIWLIFLETIIHS